MSDSAKASTPCDPQLTIVIVTYQSVNTIGATVEALQESLDTGLARIIVIDNVSSDGTADYISSTYPSINLIRNIDNVGFGKGCNQGIEIASTPYVLLLNPDAVINTKSLTILMDFQNRNPRVGICGPAVIDASGALQPAGGLPKPWEIVLKPLSSKLVSKGQRLVIPGEAPSQTDKICGSIMLLRKKMIDEIGVFDPRFFLYFEETDLCYRARQAGWGIWTVGEAIGRHINAASAKQTKAEMMWDTISEHYFRSRFYYIIKHFGWPAAIIAEIGELGFMLLKTVLDLFRGKLNIGIRARLRAPILRLPASPNRRAGRSGYL